MFLVIKIFINAVHSGLKFDTFCLINP